MKFLVCGLIVYTPSMNCVIQNLDTRVQRLEAGPVGYTVDSHGWIEEILSK